MLHCFSKFIYCVLSAHSYRQIAPWGVSLLSVAQACGVGFIVGIKRKKERGKGGGGRERQTDRKSQRQTYEQRRWRERDTLWKRHKQRQSEMTREKRAEGRYSDR